MTPSDDFRLSDYLPLQLNSLSEEERTQLRALTAALEETHQEHLREVTRFCVDAHPDHAAEVRLVLAHYCRTASSPSDLAEGIGVLHRSMQMTDAQSLVVDLYRRVRPAPVEGAPLPPRKEFAEGSTPGAERMGLQGEHVPVTGRIMPPVVRHAPPPPHPDMSEAQRERLKPYTTGLGDADIDDIWRLVKAGGRPDEYIPLNRRVPKRMVLRREEATPGTDRWLLPEDPRHPQHGLWRAQQRTLRLDDTPIALDPAEHPHTPAEGAQRAADSPRSGPQSRQEAMAIPKDTRNSEVPF